jgi:two-component system sensor histidine kinase AtoS
MNSLIGRQLNLARRYLWGALVAALIPLVVMAVLYDRYSANLVDTLVTNRVEADVEATAVRMSSFIAVQVNKLESIVDLSDTSDFFVRKQDQKIPALLKDLLLLETESPDVYAIELSTKNGELITQVPSSRALDDREGISEAPFIRHGNTEIIGPILPQNGKPGWFLIRMPVLHNEVTIGIVSLRMRLASLTELASQLSKSGVYRPQIIVFDRVRMSVVGTLDPPEESLAHSRHFLPGWRIHLVDDGGNLDEPLNQIRYGLLVAAALSAFGLIFLFLKMSQRLSGYLAPLTEGARAVANGDFSVDVDEDGPGELGALARSYNRMRQQLEGLINSRVEVERRAALGGMAAGIAHEIRNPLATVATTVHGLKRNEVDEERQQMFEVISSEIDRVDRTIGEFLNYAKPRAPDPEPVLIRDAFRSIRTLLATHANAESVVIDLSGDSALTIKIDQAHFSQILLNLCLNAIAAMPDGGHLRLQAYREGKEAVVTVTDDGSGIDAETRSKMFRPFFTTRTAGSGLGLSVTKQLVETNGGSFKLESDVGVGTVVTMCFSTNIREESSS